MKHYNQLGAQLYFDRENENEKREGKTGFRNIDFT